ncbi:hypothetical protein DRN69_01585 [Candidatus Pacearchaeota archaeon]|nr:MAG: hypothetical protein DRN69_01585 [Candidatus Pacearchaeota archaeon]
MKNMNKKLLYILKTKNIMINKENKKLIFGIILAALVFLSYQVIASYMTNPVDSNLKYPNPGHYPGEIGPGTFNCSGTGSNCYFKFTDDFGNTGLKIINGTTEIYKGLHVASGYPLVVDSDTYLGNDSSDKTIVKGDLEVSGKGNFYELCIQGNCTTVWPTGGEGGGGPITFDVWNQSVSDSDSCSVVGDTATVNCTVQIPDGYTVIYAQGGTGYHQRKSPAGQDWYNNFYADKCAFPSYEKTIMAGGTIGGPTIEGVCRELPCLGKKGPTTCELTSSFTCSASAGQTYTYDVKCGIYVIAVKATGAGVGAIEDIWVNETGDTMTGDLNVTGGLVVGNPDEGNKGSGTINAEKIYVNGSEVGTSAGVCYTVYCSDDSDYIDSPMCPTTVTIGTQGPCKAGYTVKESLGSWGFCRSGVNSVDYIFLPPGGSCGSLWNYGTVIGRAYVCCK